LKLHTFFHPLALAAICVAAGLSTASAAAATDVAAVAAPPSKSAPSAPPPSQPAVAPAQAGPAAPPPPPPAADPVKTAEAAFGADRDALIQLQNQAQAISDDGRLAAMGKQASAIQATAEGVVAARGHDLIPIDQALKRLVPRKGRTETASQRRQRAPLLARRAPIQADINQAQALATLANQTFNTIAERRREGFSAKFLQRTDSPVSPDFWTSVAGAVGADAGRLVTAAQTAQATALDAPEPKGLLSLAFGILMALVIAFPGRRWLEHFGRRKSAEAHTTHGFTQTANALWIAVVDTGAPTLAAIAAHLAARWGGLLSNKADSMATSGVIAVAWGAAVIALGRVLATDPDTNRRLLDLPDSTATRIQAPLWMVAVISGAGFLLTRLNYVIGASVSATITANCVLSLAYVGVAALILLSFDRGKAPSPGDERVEVNEPIWTLISLSLSAAIVVTIGAVLSGYTTLAALISGQIFWFSMLAALTYLVMRFIDTLCGALFNRQGWAGKTLTALFGLHVSTINQLGLLLSAGLQLMALLTALGLAVTPFGASGDLLLGHFSKFAEGIHVGSATLSLTAIGAGLASLAVGMGLVHLVRGWIVKRYLPVTDWDAGIRNSVSTGVGYLGAGLTFLWALAAMGLGFQQIALVASALSVGVGFGLQQVVQNLAAGIILLIERPVKVGDWVAVDGVEGDIRRIRVRATEIETSDRSTVIVPNSDLITKQVQNKTLRDPPGRVQVQLSVARAADVRKAMELILETATRRDDVLKTPPPAVYVDAVAAGGAVTFNCLFFVDTPRHVSRIRSDLYLQLLDALQAAEIAL